MPRISTIPLAFALTLVACHGTGDRPPIGGAPSNARGRIPAADGGASPDGGSPIAPVVVAEHLGVVADLATDGDTLVAALPGTSSTEGAGVAPLTGAIVAIPLDAGAAVASLATHEDAPSAVTLAAASAAPSAVYWTRRGTTDVTGGLAWLPPSSSVAVAVTSGEPGASAIAHDASFVYWASRFGAAGLLVERARLGDPAPETLFTLSDDVDASALVVDGPSLYLVARGDPSLVLRAPAAGGLPDELLRLAGASLDAVTLVGSTLYLADARDDGAILALPTTGGAAVRIAAARHPARIAHDDAWLYWTEDVPQGALVRRPLAGGDAEPRLAPLAHPHALTVGAAVYLATDDAVLAVPR